MLGDADIPIAPLRIIDMSLGDVERSLNDRGLISRALELRRHRTSSGRDSKINLRVSPMSESAALPLPDHLDSLREYLDESQGEGYWDLFRLSAGDRKSVV